MKTTITTVIFILMTIYTNAQSPKEVFVMKNDANVDNILKRFDTGNDNCGLDLYSVGSYARLIISRKLDDSTFVVVLSKNNSGDNMAEINKYYCISKSSLDNYFKRKAKPEIGILTVPFKLRIDPIKVMAGNTVGPFIGKKFYHQNETSSILLIFASLTNVPLNDLNASVPETKWGLGIGTGYVWTIAENFQTGIITGIDLFEGVESWPYKFQPWLSLSIGYSFTSTKKEEQALNLAR
jgi:hypothetical protein